MKLINRIEPGQFGSIVADYKKKVAAKEQESYHVNLGGHLFTNPFFQQILGGFGYFVAVLGLYLDTFDDLIISFTT